MTDLNRRHLLAGAAATGAAALTGLGPITARAAAPQAGTQAPGFYRYKVGTHEITVVTDGATTNPLADNFVLNKKKDEVNAALAAAADRMVRRVRSVMASSLVARTGRTIPPPVEGVCVHKIW